MLPSAFTNFAVACSQGGSSSFFGFPHWYEYLNQVSVNGLCSPQITSITDVWLIAAAVIEILLRIATLVAVGFVVYGGFEYVTSQGDPATTAKARGTVINALVGLAIAVMAAVIVSFIAGSIN